MKKEKALDTFTNEKVRFVREDADTYFVYAKGKSTRGYRMNKDAFNKRYRPIEIDETAAWHKRLKRAISKLEKSGLWSDVLEKFRYIINSQMTLDEFYELSRHTGYHTIVPEIIYEKYKSKFPEVFVLNDNGTFSIDYSFFEEYLLCKIKTIYFGDYNSYYKKNIILAMQDQCEYHTPRIDCNYDISFSYDPKSKKAWYSEEYKGCGNGHYYLAIDSSTALFYEND